MIVDLSLDLGVFGTRSPLLRLGLALGKKYVVIIFFFNVGIAATAAAHPFHLQVVQQTKSSSK
jgi:hypothetical protein